VITISDEKKQDFALSARPAAIEWLKNTIDTPSLVDDVIREVELISNN